jgi:hypothetical protein
MATPSDRNALSTCVFLQVIAAASESASTAGPGKAATKSVPANPTNTIRQVIGCPPICWNGFFFTGVLGDDYGTSGTLLQLF